MQRPTNSNADEWHAFLAENTDALGYVAVQIAEALDEERKRGEIIAAYERIDPTVCATAPDTPSDLMAEWGRLYEQLPEDFKEKRKRAILARI